MIITTTTTLVVMTHTMIFTMMALETRKRKTRTTTTGQNHQAPLSQSHRQFHLDFMETQPNPAVGQITVEYTLEVVSMLLPVILNLMPQHQEFQTTGLGQSTL